MEYMTTKEAEKKWNISERRIRQLLQDGRIAGAVKIGNSWNIPSQVNKPFDKRTIKYLDDKYFEEVDNLKKELRLKYYDALDKVHTAKDYTDFVKLITELEIEMLKKYLNLL